MPIRMLVDAGLITSPPERSNEKKRSSSTSSSCEDKGFKPKNPLASINLKKTLSVLYVLHEV